MERNTVLDGELAAVATRLAAAAGAADDLPSVLRDYRREYDLTQAQLAQRLGVSRVTLARVETGTRKPSAALLAALAELGMLQEAA